MSCLSSVTPHGLHYNSIVDEAVPTCSFPVWTHGLYIVEVHRASTVKIIQLYQTYRTPLCASFVSPPFLQCLHLCNISVMFDVLMDITSDHIDFVDAVDYRGGVTTGDFGLRIGEKTDKRIEREK